MAPRPRLAVIKLASCDGCQLQLLSCEDELYALGQALDIALFAEATSRPDDGGPFDVCLIEGSVCSAEQREHVLSLRARSRTLVAIGACATAGGIQALRNGRELDAFRRVVYASAETIDALETVEPISSVVKVDAELRGCPIDKRQLVELITSMLLGRRPAILDESVCVECKRAGQVCILVTRGEPCLGPVTHAGCGALCPRFDRGCYGCFGPKEQANTRALGDRFEALGQSATEVGRLFAGINASAPAFREEVRRRGLRVLAPGASRGGSDD